MSLEPAERERLKGLHRGTRDGRVRDRIKVVLAADKGYTHAQIADMLLLSESAVREHLKDYETREGKLAPANGGRVAKLDAGQAAGLVAHLEAVTYLRTSEIAAYVAATYGVQYSVSGMTAWLHAQGFSWKKPAARPGKADAAAQEAWIRHYEQTLNHLGDDETVYFVDAVHPTHAVKLSCGWIRTGTRKEVPSSSGRQRLNLLGACSLHSLTALVREAVTIDGAAVIAFFQHLERETKAPGTIHLFLDNARYFKSREVQAWLQTSRIRLHFLPPYSPNLNPIERLWRFMYQKVLSNQYFEKFSGFKAAIFGFFDKISSYHSELQTRLTDNFQRIQPLRQS